MANSDRTPKGDFTAWQGDLKERFATRLALGPWRIFTFEAFPIDDASFVRGTGAKAETRPFELILPMRGTILSSFVSVAPTHPNHAGIPAEVTDFEISLAYNGMILTTGVRDRAGRVGSDAFVGLTTFARDWVHADGETDAEFDEGDRLVATFRMADYARNRRAPARIRLHFAIAPRTVH